MKIITLSIALVLVTAAFAKTESTVKVGTLTFKEGDAECAPKLTAEVTGKKLSIDPTARAKIEKWDSKCAINAAKQKHEEFGIAKSSSGAILMAKLRIEAFCNGFNEHAEYTYSFDEDTKSKTLSFDFGGNPNAKGLKCTYSAKGK